MRSCVSGNCEIDYFKLILSKRINRTDGQMVKKKSHLWYQKTSRLNFEGEGGD